MYLSMKLWLNLKRFSKGYTLLEVLIATLIFSSIVLIATGALNQSMSQYKALMERGVSFWDYAKYEWIQRSFASALDYYVNDEKGNWFPYFIGNQDYVSYISLPLTAEGAVAVWIKKEKQKNGNYSIVYYELPIYAENFKDIQKKYTFEEYKKGLSVVLWNDLKEVEIEYYGYDFSKNAYEWFKSYEGIKRLILPEMIRFSLMKDNDKFSVIFRININSTYKWYYNEIFG